MLIFVLVNYFSFVTTSAYCCVLFDLCVNQLFCMQLFNMYVLKCTVVFHILGTKYRLLLSLFSCKYII